MKIKNSAVMSNKHVGGSDQWETDSKIYNMVNEVFHFTLDAAAEDSTTKCSKWFTEEDNALEKDWEGQSVWLNPPYSKIRKFAPKALQEAEKGATVVLFVPSRTDTTAFHDVFSKGQIYFMKGRVKFLLDGVMASAPAPFPTMVVVLSPEALKNP